MRGRKPLPPELKPGAEPPAAGDLLPIPECPDWLDPDAKALWSLRARGLHAKGLLSPTTAETFAGLCQCWAEWKQATELYRLEGRVIATGNGMTRIHPMVAHAAEMARQFRAYAAEFGMTPASRGRAGNGGDSKASDGLDDFLS